MTAAEVLAGRGCEGLRPSGYGATMVASRTSRRSTLLIHGVRPLGPLFAAVAIASTWPGLACLGCPDLAYFGWLIDVSGPDAATISMTAAEHGSGVIVCEATSPNSCAPGAGVYDLSFLEGGTEVASVSGVCTLGDQTGCDAEDAEAKGPAARVDVVQDGTSWTATLVTQGPCP